MNFFTADLHFNHAAIIQYCRRSFDSLEKMNQKLIENWNSKVSDTDTVWVVGDFAFSDNKYFLDQLHGTKHLILGSHDRVPREELENVGFQSVQRYREFPLRDTKFILAHCPMRCWEYAHDGSIHLFGHVHGRITTYNLSMDVGVDTNEFYPYSEDEIFALMRKRREQMEQDGRVFVREGGRLQYYQDDVRWFEHLINTFRSNSKSVRKRFPTNPD